MILLVTALYAEAKPFIQRFSMKKQSLYNRFQVFGGMLSSDEPVMLLITGTGKIRAAAAVSSLLTELAASSPQIFLVNVGIAGGAGEQVEGAVYCHTVRDAVSGRVFYPDLLPHPFVMGEVRTCDTVVGGGEAQEAAKKAEPVMIDMEASGICEAARLFLTADQMAVLKIESDRTEGETVTPQDAEAFVGGQADRIAAWLRELAKRRCRADAKKEERRIRREQFTELAHAAGNVLRCSVSMQAQLDRRIAYMLCLQEPAREKVRALLEECRAQAVCASKREGKRFFAVLMKQIEAACEDGGAEQEAVEKRREPVCKEGTFSCIYIEEALWDSEEANRLRMRCPGSRMIQIRHFKDIFNRPRQNVLYQKQAQALILAKKSGTLVYEGAPVCQDFGNAHFYYASCIMNCVYDCEYCYLQGMYPCGHVVVFANLEEIFAQVDALLQEHPVYLCVSFDTDLLALEALFSYGRRWCEFASGRPGLTVEIRTKGTGAYFFWEMEGRTIPENVILAWTLSPQRVISAYEHGTASLQARVHAAARALEMGFSVRLCFDPLLRIEDGETQYRKMLETVFQEIPAGRIRDVSVGVFRISQEYLKQMRRNRPYSAVTQFPYCMEEGVAHYGKEESRRMMEWMKRELESYVEERKIFLWDCAAAEESEDGKTASQREEKV